MRNRFLTIFLTFILAATLGAMGQTPEYFMPEETEPHEGTWIQWPHNHLYGPYYQDDVSPTFVAMTDALQQGEVVHIIAYNNLEQTYITNAFPKKIIPPEKSTRSALRNSSTLD